MSFSSRAQWCRITIPLPAYDASTAFTTQACSRCSSRQHPLPPLPTRTTRTSNARNPARSVARILAVEHASTRETTCHRRDDVLTALHIYMLDMRTTPTPDPRPSCASAAEQWGCLPQAWAYGAEGVGATRGVVEMRERGVGGYVAGMERSELAMWTPEEECSCRRGLRVWWEQERKAECGQEDGRSAEYWGEDGVEGRRAQSGTVFVGIICCRRTWISNGGPGAGRGEGWGALHEQWMHNALHPLARREITTALMCASKHAAGAVDFGGEVNVLALAWRARDGRHSPPAGRPVRARGRRREGGSTPTSDCMSVPDSPRRSPPAPSVHTSTRRDYYSVPLESGVGWKHGSSLVEVRGAPYASPRPLFSSREYVPARVALLHFRRAGQKRGPLRGSPATVCIEVCRVWPLARGAGAARARRATVLHRCGCGVEEHGGCAPGAPDAGLGYGGFAWNRRPHSSAIHLPTPSKPHESSLVSGRPGAIRTSVILIRRSHSRVRAAHNTGTTSRVPRNYRARAHFPSQSQCTFSAVLSCLFNALTGNTNIWSFKLEYKSQFKLQRTSSSLRSRVLVQLPETQLTRT
ncbi:hypothetical protein B0H11DRAFT_1939380 [Mycena galericulata]|nr:hypothetical protein B0H11DRAFT_1939380 [Mycena galericulata]